MATINIRRTSEYINALRNYRIFIDGQKIGKISNGQTKEFEIPSGSHSVVAKIDWCRSPELSFEINDNDTKTFLVGGLKNGKWIMPLILVIISLSFLLSQVLNSTITLFFTFPPLLLLVYYLTFGSKDYLTFKEL